ncbi:MAG: DUF3179 domain-containing (seleno)protein [bacterium]|nr:DUF3179 domain-containing (seleno)protein [bacterium]
MNPISSPAPAFDVSRAHLQDYLDTDKFPARLEISDSVPLRDALAEGRIAPETEMLSFEQEGILYTFPMQMILSYNVIQGQISPEKPWVMTFCNACNTGVVFDPTVNGQLRHFERRGAYDGLMLIHDAETGSFWQHITGEALHGVSVGQRLRMIANTRRVTAAEAAARATPVLLLSAPLTPEQQKLARYTTKMTANPEIAQEAITSTFNPTAEDTRRPRFELGLGVWTDDHSIFYPLTSLHMHDNIVRTTFAGRPLLVYQAPDAFSPSAVYLDTRTAYWEGDILRLDQGMTLRHEVLYDANGAVLPLERPNQLLMRWFGFAFTFPGTHLPDF